MSLGAWRVGELKVGEMSTLHVAARAAGRLGVVLLAGGSAAVASVWGASARGPPPADLPGAARL